VNTILRTRFGEDTSGQGKRTGQRNENIRNKMMRQGGRNGRGGARMPTRAEALMHLLQSAGCPESEMQTLKNTVANQEVRELNKEEVETEYSKCSEWIERSYKVF
jgi:hypothetical protein